VKYKEEYENGLTLANNDTFFDDDSSAENWNSTF
jgi:hypothetical protein